MMSAWRIFRDTAPISECAENSRFERIMPHYLAKITAFIAENHTVNKVPPCNFE